MTFEEAVAMISKSAKYYRDPTMPIEEYEDYPIAYDKKFQDNLSVKELMTEQGVDFKDLKSYYGYLEDLAEKSGTLLELKEEVIYFTDSSKIE